MIKFRFLMTVLQGSRRADETARLVVTASVTAAFRAGRALGRQRCL